MEKEDAYYIAQSLKGDTCAYGVLVERYQGYVFALVRSVCSNAADAQELAQDVFVKAYQNLSTFRKEAGFSTWLYRIAYNTAISGVRKKKSRERLANGYSRFLSTSDSVDEEYVEDARFEQLQGLLKELPPEERLLIELYYYKELKMDQVAYICGLSESNAKVRLFRIRQKLLTQWKTF